MDVEFVVHIDNRVREAVMRLSQRRYLLFSLFTIPPGILMAIWLAAWWMLGEHVQWWCVFLAGVFILLPLFSHWTREHAIRKALEAANRLGDYDVTHHITDEHLESKSPHGSGTLPWRAFIRLDRHPEFWLLFHTHATGYVLPVEVMRGDLGEFVMRKVRENGGKVK